MNAEHQALAEYLESYLNERLQTLSKDLFIYMDHRFNKAASESRGEFKEVHRRIDVLTNHVDKKNDKQDEVFQEQIENHELRIATLESDYRILTS